MFRFNNGQFSVNPPAMVVFQGYKHNFADLTREQWDEIGYNEAIPVEREPYTIYETEWAKGDDFVLREVVLSKVVDWAAKIEDARMSAREKRDARLDATDWTQLVDCPLDDMDIVLWQSYRQALRDVPQQEGFPLNVEWPEEPVAE
jgi:hypothetical protein